MNGSVDDVSSFRRSPMASSNNISQNREAVKKFSLDTDNNRVISYDEAGKDRSRRFVYA